MHYRVPTRPMRRSRRRSVIRVAFSATAHRSTARDFQFSLWDAGLLETRRATRVSLTTVAVAAGLFYGKPGFWQSVSRRSALAGNGRQDVPVTQRS